MTNDNIIKSIKEIEQNLTILKAEIGLLVNENESLLKENKKLKEK